MFYLFSGPEYAHFWGFGGTYVSLVNSYCHSVSFCVVLSVISVLNSQAIQSEACISAAKYKHLPFFSGFWKLFMLAVS